MVKLLKLKNALDKKISKVSKEGTITTAIVPLFPLWENNYGNKNWKEYPKVQEVKEKFENEKVRSSMRWVFQIMVTLVFAAVVAIMMFQTVTMQESSMEPTISVGDRFL